MLKHAPLSGVKILPGLFRSRMKLNEDYLMELDSVCLLQNFYLEAGIQLPGQQSVPDPASAKRHLPAQPPGGAGTPSEAGHDPGRHRRRRPEKRRGKPQTDRFR